jgi:hypothetical protein
MKTAEGRKAAKVGKRLHRGALNPACQIVAESKQWLPPATD